MSGPHVRYSCLVLMSDTHSLHDFYAAMFDFAKKVVTYFPFFVCPHCALLKLYTFSS